MDLRQTIETAVIKNDLNILKNIFKEVEVDTLKFLLNDISYPTPLLHLAVAQENLDLVTLLLKNGANPAQVDNKGRTALHEAIISRSINTACIILKTISGTDFSDEADGSHTNSLAFDSIAALTLSNNFIHIEDYKGLTPWLLLIEVSLEINEFDTMVELLVDSGSDINQCHPVTGRTVLFKAVEMDSLRSCNLLSNLSALNLSHVDFEGNSVFHIAAQKGLKQMLGHLIECSNQHVNTKNNSGNTPLHQACSCGSRECLTLLVNNGGDLSLTNNESISVMDAIFCNLPRPAAYLSELFDSKIVSNGLSINDHQLEITVNFAIFFSNHSGQMAVVIALIDALGFHDDRELLQHPLIETYLRFKWSKIRVFFFLLVIIHFAFVISLSVFVTMMVTVDLEHEFIWSQRVVFVTTAILGCHIALQTALAPRYFLREPETWLGGACIVLSLIMSVSGEIIPAPSDSDWVRHLAAFTILLSWGHVMFILGRFPTIGFFALMFFTVLKNVVKVLLIFACLVIGFSLSFSIQFNNFQYDGPWRAFIRTTVMLMGEYEYGDLFADGKFPTRFEGKPSALGLSSQFIFLLFLLLGSIVLINLMVGLAVNDIQGLQLQGHLKQMMKQAEFIFHTDRLLSHIKLCESRKRIPRHVTLNPSTTSRMWANKYRGLWSHIPKRVIDNVIAVAIKQNQPPT